VKLPDINEMMKTAQTFGKRLAEIKEELAHKTVVGTAGGGMVTVTANGQGQLVKIEIEPEVIDPEESDMLQDLIVAAANQALEKSRQMAAEATKSLTGGVSIPGMDGLFG
jgi:DNA-binding YbaB/EbfC family protein